MGKNGKLDEDIRIVIRNLLQGESEMVVVKTDFLSKLLYSYKDIFIEEIEILIKAELSSEQSSFICNFVLLTTVASSADLYWIAVEVFQAYLLNSMFDPHITKI